MDEIERLIRETPLNERIDKAISMIGSMCAGGRYPKMSVPVHPTDEDVFITTTLLDAKMEIKALREIISSYSERVDILRGIVLEEKSLLKTILSNLPTSINLDTDSTESLK